MTNRFRARHKEKPLGEQKFSFPRGTAHVTLILHSKILGIFLSNVGNSWFPLPWVDSSDVSSPKHQKNPQLHMFSYWTLQFYSAWSVYPYWAPSVCKVQSYKIRKQMSRCKCTNFSVWPDYKALVDTCGKCHWKDKSRRDNRKTWMPNWRMVDHQQGVHRSHLSQQTDAGSMLSRPISALLPTTLVV